MELRSDDLAFELRYASGDIVRIFVDGRVEGLPPNTIVINWLDPLLDCLQAREECGYPGRDNPPLCKPREGRPQSLRRQEKNNSPEALSPDGCHTLSQPEALARL